LLSVYIKCAAEVRTAYNTCDTVIIPITGPVQDTDANTAKCVRDRVNPKPVLASMISAVHTGRATAKGIIDEAKNAVENQKKKDQCEADGNTWENNKCTPGDGSQQTCAVDGIGWIVCPVMLFVTKLNDAAFGFLNNFLEIPASTFNDTAAKQAWEAFRNFSNVGFIIVFIVIIYSQITGAGISNYGLKKLLPKLIIATLLANTSFYICAIAVDISNIVGATLYDLLKNFDIGSRPPNSDAETLWANAGAVILAGGAIIGLVALLIFAPTALLGFGMAILILLFRQSIAVILIALSSLPAVAWVLPGTQGISKSFLKVGKIILVLYPVVSLTLGGGILASHIVISAGQSGGSETQAIVGLAIMALPLLALPAILKAALAGIQTVGNMASSYQDRANKSSTQKLKQSRLGEAKMAYGVRHQVRKLNNRRGNGTIATFANARAGKGVKGRTFSAIGKLATAQKRFDESSLGQTFGGNRGAAAATSALFKESGDEVGRQKTLTSGRATEGAGGLMEDVISGKGSDEYQMAIAGEIMSRGHRASHQQALAVIDHKMRAATASGDTKEQERLGSIQKQMFHDMKEKPFGMGDSAVAQLEAGTYGQTIDPATGKATASTGADIYQATQQRIETALSEKKLALMNPDDARVLYEQARGGHLSQPQKDHLIETIEAARKGHYRGDIKPEVDAMYDDMLDNFDPAKRIPFPPGDPHKSNGLLPQGYVPK
jgi:hypothetical protein